MRLPRRERQEVNFGTVCTSFAQGSAAIRRDAHRHQKPLSGQGYVTGDRPKSARSRACPSSAHFCGACELNVPHILGQPCASERSSWTFSHLCMMIVDADSHTCRRGHPVLCCPLHGRSGRCVPDRVGSNRGLVGWSSATVMARIKALTGLFECCGEHCAAHQGLECPCAALGSPQGPHASCVVSVRWFIGARLAGTGLLCAPTVCGGSAPNGYTNNLGVMQATVMLSMGQRCACSTRSMLTAYTVHVYGI